MSLQPSDARRSNLSEVESTELTPSLEGDDSGLRPSDALLREVAHAPERPLPNDDGARIGTTFGRFRILETLGRGGMGVVYAARDERLSRVVALKLLHGHSSLDEDRRRRLLREARAACAISHPGIATVFEVGESDGQVFVAMERVRGRTLRAALATGALTVHEAARVGVAIARALGAAHEAGILHRDLKPDNVMLSDDGSVKILDFGLAKSLEGAELGDPNGSTFDDLTQDGCILGTPNYMSPEQANGSAVDQRSDVFSLGVVLYEMLCGQRPFRGATRLATLVAVSHDPPEPIRRLRAEVPRSLAGLVERCLAKDPAARPRDGNAVAVELELALAGGRRTSLRIGAVLVALSVIAGLVAVLVSRRPTPTPMLLAPLAAESPPNASPAGVSPPSQVPVVVAPASVPSAESLVSPAGESAKPVRPKAAVPHVKAIASAAPAPSAVAPPPDPLAHQK